MSNYTLHLGDSLAVLRALPEQSVQCVVTSPPYYGLRDYKVDGQIGLEETPAAYVTKMVAVFAEVWRVLRDDGTLWLNLGDSYYSQSQSGGTGEASAYRGKAYTSDGVMTKTKVNMDVKPKDLLGIPWRVAFALQDAGWYLRSDIIWHKPNPMPESVTDRPTKSHEYVFLLSKSQRYYYDGEAVKEASIYPDDNRKERSKETQKRFPGEVISGMRCGSAIYPFRNRRTVWTIATAPYAEAHFATFPPALVEPCILAGTSAKGACPKCGRGWERVVSPSPEYQKKLEVANARGDWYSRKETTDKRIDGTKQGKLEGGITSEYFTLGWRPACACDAGEPVPCVVLDPFNGSGTTGAVALKFGRDYIGIDLSAEYLEMSRRRLAKVQPMLDATMA